MNVVPSGKELGKSNEDCIDFDGASRRQLRSYLKGFMLLATAISFAILVLDLRLGKGATGGFGISEELFEDIPYYYFSHNNMKNINVTNDMNLFVSYL